ncbi:MAG: TolC family protein [Deltaproteobacteria bacterium]|nr:TolC family protein [Deltaproteobacteria bacterium]
MLQRRLEAASRELHVVLEQQKAGIGTPLSQKMAELRVLQAERSAAAGKVAYQAAIASLGMLIGADKRFDVEGSLAPELPSGDVAKLVRDAISRRPELRMMREQQKLAEFRVSETRKRWLPRLGLSGQTQWSNAAGFGGQNVTSALMITVTQQIWDGGASSLDRREAAANLRIVHLEAEKSARQIGAEVRGALLAVDRAKADLGAATRGVDVSAAAVEDARIGRKIGTNTELEQLGLEDRLVEAQLAVVQARIGVSLAILDVRSALGLPPM